MEILNIIYTKIFTNFQKKKYIIDDGTSSLGINKLLRKIDTSNTTLFTVYKNINFKKIKIIQNDYKFLKTLNLTKKTSLKKELHFISSKIGENLKNPIRYYKMLNRLNIVRKHISSNRLFSTWDTKAMSKSALGFL